MYDNNLSIYKDYKSAIGGKDLKNKVDFTKHNFKAKKGDKLFIFSDGYVDQFGGSGNRKFTTKRIKNLLLDQSKSSIDMINLSLKTEFIFWKGDEKQTDDLLLLSVEV